MNSRLFEWPDSLRSAWGPAYCAPRPPPSRRWSGCRLASATCRESDAGQPGITEVSSAIICSSRCKSGISGVSLTMRTWQMIGRALGKAARGIGPHHIGVHAHELRKPLGQHAEVPGLQLAAGGVKDHDSGAAGDGRQRLAERAFEGHHRHAAPAPAHETGVPRRRIGHFGRRLIADDLGDAGARHDQSLPRQRHQQAIQLVAQIGHGAHLATALRRLTSGSMASSSWLS